MMVAGPPRVSGPPRLRRLARASSPRRCDWGKADAHVAAAPTSRPRVAYRRLPRCGYLALGQPGCGHQRTGECSASSNRALSVATLLVGLVVTKHDLVLCHVRSQSVLMICGAIWRALSIHRRNKRMNMIACAVLQHRLYARLWRHI